METAKESEGNRTFRLLGNDITELKEALLSSLDRLKTALRETKATASSEIQQYVELRQRAEAKLVELEAQLQEKQELLGTRDSTIRELKENLTAKIDDLEHRLSEKEALLRARQVELNDLRSEVDVLGASPEGFVALREEDVVTLEVMQNNEEEVAYPPERQEKLTEDLKGLAGEGERLRAELRDRILLLQAKEMEVKMIKQSLEERERELKTISQRQARREPRPRLISILTAMEKKN